MKRDQPALFNPSERSEDAVSFVKLCPVPTTLGDKLLEAMTALSGDDQDIPKHSKDCYMVDIHEYNFASSRDYVKFPVVCLSVHF